MVCDSSVENSSSVSRRPNSAPLFSERSFMDEFLPVHPSVGHRAGCPRECPPADAHMGLPGCAFPNPLPCHSHARKREKPSPPEGASAQKVGKRSRSSIRGAQNDGDVPAFACSGDIVRDQDLEFEDAVSDEPEGMDQESDSPAGPFQHHEELHEMWVRSIHSEMGVDHLYQ